MSKPLEGRSAVGRKAVLALALLFGALLACRHNGPNQPGTVTGADLSRVDAALPDAGDARAVGDAGSVGDAGPAALGMAAPADGGKSCRLGGVTQSQGTQIVMFRQAGDFEKLLAAADAGANQQQRTEQFRNAGGILVPFGTACTVLETASTVTRVQITEGSWMGTQGWVPGDSVTIH
jgi:hypothetical protein